MTAATRIANALNRIATAPNVVRTREQDELRDLLNGGSNGELTARMERAAARFEKAAARLEAAIK